MAVYAKITSNPPLGQLTQFSDDKKDIPFTVLVEISTAMPHFPWEVTLCYKDTSSATTKTTKWTEVPLKKSESLPMMLDGVDAKSDSMVACHRDAFTGSLPFKVEGSDSLQSAVFTVKYRLDASSPWYRVESQFGIQNGEIMVQPTKVETELATLLKVEQGWTVSSFGKGSEVAKTYTIESRMLAASGGPVDHMTSVLGVVVDQERFFALVQMPEPWLFPRHGKQTFDIPEEAIMCSVLTRNGYTVTLLGLSGFQNVRVVFKSTDDGEVQVVSQNDGSKGAKAQIVASVATNLEASIKAVMDAAREILKTSETKAVGKVEGDESSSEWEDSEDSITQLNDWYDGLAYCTWNSLGYDLSTPKILSGLDSLEEAGIKVSTLIIDDNWQSIDYDFDKKHRMHQGMERFEAVESAFPDGLASAVSEIREKHSYIKDIAVWHALLGYWGGISPTGKLAQDYKTVSIPARLLVEHKEEDITFISPSEVAKFYDDFYTFLASCGVTAVKTDAQYMMGELLSGPDRASFLDTYPKAWTSAHLKHFSGRAISCMSMIPQNLLLSYLPTQQPRVMLRNSDDFFPEIATSHPLHVFINAHNALFTQHLNVLPDWDMFQTAGPNAAFHAAARCVSGGPIYITDTPKEHDIEVIREMTALSPSGKTVALRPTKLGRTIGGWNNFHDGHVLKIGTFTGQGETGTSILSLFNIAEKPITSLIPLSDFPTEDFPTTSSPAEARIDDSTEDKQSTDFLIRSHRTDRIFPPLSARSSDPSTLIHSSLAIRDHEILYKHSIQTLTLRKSTLNYSILGLLQKFTGPAAITSFTAEKSALKVGLKALGRLGIWFADRRTEDDVAVKVARHELGTEWWRIVRVAGEGQGEACVLEIDVEGFWDALGLKLKKGETEVVVVVTLD